MGVSSSSSNFNECNRSTPIVNEKVASRLHECIAFFIRIFKRLCYRCFIRDSLCNRCFIGDSLCSKCFIRNRRVQIKIKNVLLTNKKNTCSIYVRNRNTDETLKYKPEFLGLCIKQALRHEDSLSYVISIASLFSITFNYICFYLNVLATDKQLIFRLLLSKSDRLTAKTVSKQINNMFDSKRYVLNYENFPIKPSDPDCKACLDDAQKARASANAEDESVAYSQLLFKILGDIPLVTNRIYDALGIIRYFDGGVYV